MYVNEFCDFLGQYNGKGFDPPASRFNDSVVDKSHPDQGTAIQSQL